MPIRPIEIMEKHTYDPNNDGVIEAAQIGRLSKADFEITLDKLLKGAGAGTDPTEIDEPVGITAGEEALIFASV